MLNRKDKKIIEDNNIKELSNEYIKEIGNSEIEKLKEKYKQ